MKLFVCGFYRFTRVSAVAGLFEECGEVTSVRLRMGEKRAYAIVEMPDYHGEQAIRELNGTRWEGELLEVSQSKW
jgi:RNA recognition motif-containing protein